MLQSGRSTANRSRWYQGARVRIGDRQPSAVAERSQGYRLLCHICQGWETFCVRLRRQNRHHLDRKF